MMSVLGKSRWYCMLTPPSTALSASRSGTRIESMIAIPTRTAPELNMPMTFRSLHDGSMSSGRSRSIPKRRPSKA